DGPRRYVSVRPLNCDGSVVCATAGSKSMTQAELLETQLASTPTVPSGAMADELPDDLLREATQRLGILALVWAGLFGIGLLMNDLAAPLMNIPIRDLIPRAPP